MAGMLPSFDLVGVFAQAIELFKYLIKLVVDTPQALIQVPAMSESKKHSSLMHQINLHVGFLGGFA